MDSADIALISFICVFGAALLGTFSYRLLEPELSDNVRDALRQILGMISMMASLALGLMVASSYGLFNTRNDAIDRISADIIQVDRVLAIYGSEAKNVRTSLRHILESTIERGWPDEGSGRVQLETGKVPTSVEDIQRSLYGLMPGNEMQKKLQTRALFLFDDMLQTRALALENVKRQLPTPFLVVMLFWLSMAFFAIHLLVPPSKVVIAGMFVGALCLSAAIFLIFEFNNPIEGLMRLSSEPLRRALAILKQ